MKKLLFLILTLFLLIGCKKNETLVIPTSELVGTKYRSLAWVNDTFGNVYDVLEFKPNNKVEYSLRLRNDNIVNSDYTVLSNYTIDSDISITIDHKGHFDDKSEKNKATVVADVISISSGNLKGVYVKY